MGKSLKKTPSRVFTFRLPQPIADKADRALKISELCQRTVVDALAEILPKEDAEPLVREFETWDREKFYRWKK